MSTINKTGDSMTIISDKGFDRTYKLVARLFFSRKKDNDDAVFWNARIKFSEGNEKWVSMFFCRKAREKYVEGVKRKHRADMVITVEKEMCGNIWFNSYNVAGTGILELDGVKYEIAIVPVSYVDFELYMQHLPDDLSPRDMSRSELESTAKIDEDDLPF